MKKTIGILMILIQLIGCVKSPKKPNQPEVASSPPPTEEERIKSLVKSSERRSEETSGRTFIINGG